MTHHLYLTRTVHLPMRSDGSTIKNSFGVQIATANDPVTAAALAELINLGGPIAQALDDAYDAEQAKVAKRFWKAREAEAKAGGSAD